MFNIIILDMRRSFGQKTLSIRKSVAGDQIKMCADRLRTSRGGLVQQSSAGTGLWAAGHSRQTCRTTSSKPSRLRRANRVRR